MTHTTVLTVGPTLTTVRSDHPTLLAEMRALQDRPDYVPVTAQGRPPGSRTFRWYTSNCPIEALARRIEELAEESV